MSFEMTRMDERVLTFIASGNNGKTMSEIQRKFPSVRREAREAAMRLRAARLVRVERGAADHFMITDAGRGAL